MTANAPSISAPSPTSAARPIGGFWARPLAYLIDCLILLGVMFMVDFARFSGLYDPLHFVRNYMPITFPPLSFLNALPLRAENLWTLAFFLSYFSILNSHLGKGQSLGKKCSGLRVVDGNGRTLSLPHSLRRYSLLFIPGLLSSFSWIMYPYVTASVVSPLVGRILSTIGFATSLSFVYLYIFNRATRQSLHGLLTRSYVVKANHQGKLAADPVAWRRHISLISLIFVAVIALNTFNWLESRVAFNQALELKQALHQMQDKTDTFDINYEFYPSENYTSISIFLNGEPTSYEAAVNDVARAVLTTHPLLKPDSDLSVSVTFWHDERINKSETLSVAAWQERLSKE